MGVKLKADYGAVLHMPVLKEGKDRVSQLPGSLQAYTQPGNTACYPQYDNSRLIQSMEVNIHPFYFFIYKSLIILLRQIVFFPNLDALKLAYLGCVFFPCFFPKCLSGDDPDYLITGTHPYPSGPGKYNAIDLTKLHACNCSEPIQ